MTWRAGMRALAAVGWLAAVLAGLVLAGCVSESDGTPRMDSERARSLAKIRTELGATYYANGQYGVALQELEKAVNADSRYAPAYNVRGLVHMMLLEDGEAESDFRRSLELDPGDSETHNNFGWFLCQRGRERESVKHFLIAAKDPLYATPATAYLNAGMCSRKAGQTQEAGMYLQRALALQPESPKVLVELAELAFVTGDYAGAKSNFMRFEKAASGRLMAENLLLAVRIERKLGNRSAEATYTARLKKDFPDSREAIILGQSR